jgi:ATP-dependent Clp endopeptidase proteolytic subunit ClpP
MKSALRPVSIYNNTDDCIESVDVEVFNKNIYFYTEVDREKVLSLNKNLLELRNINLHSAIDTDQEPVSINLYINSLGGEVFSGFSAMDEICKIKKQVPIHTIVDGCCASAATFMSIVGSKRYIKPYSYMLIHQLSSICWGKFKELEDHQLNNKELMKRIKNIYLTNSVIPEEQLDSILDHDLWMDAETCLKYGLVDEILE